MNEARARRYLAAARDDPLVAAWIRILDEHHLPPRAEVAPHDFADSFADFFALDLVSAAVFNAADFKHRLSELTPSAPDLDRALLRLADLDADDHRKEFLMNDKFDLFDKKALALRDAEPRRALSRAEPFAPLSTPRTPAPFDLLASPAPPPASLAPLAPSTRSSELAGVRRALEPHARLPCQRVDADVDEASPGDPRTFIRDFDLRVLCCGREVELIYESGEEVGSVENSDDVTVEFLFYAQCPNCHSDQHLQVTRRLPPEAVE